jgi:predicted nucleic acid-binding protein
VIRATLDVNVLASGFPAETGTPAALIERWTNLEYEVVLSAHILEGLARTGGNHTTGSATVLNERKKR